MKQVRPYLLVVAAVILASGSLAGAEPAGKPAIRAMLQTILKYPIALGPIRAEAERNHCTTIHQDQKELVFQFTGRTNNYVRVLADGTITVESTKEVMELKQIDGLDSDLGLVWEYIRNVTAVPVALKREFLFYNCKYLLASPDTYKRLIFPPEVYKGQLRVPKCETKQARIDVPYLPEFGEAGSLFFKDKRLYRNVKLPADVSQTLVYGDHDLRTERPNPWWPVEIIVKVDAITSPTPEKLDYLGEKREMVIIVPVLPLPGEEPLPTPGMPGLPLSRGNTLALFAKEVEAWLAASGQSTPDASTSLAQLHFWLGRNYTYEQTADADKAISELEQAVALDPKSAQTYLAMARAYNAKNEPEKRGEAVKKAVEIDSTLDIFKPAEPPKEVEVPLGDFVRLTSKLDESKDDTEAFGKALSPMRELLSVGLGFHLLRQQKPEDAAAKFSDAISMNMQSRDARFGRIACWEALGKRENLESDIREIIKLWPGDPEVHAFACATAQKNDIIIAPIILAIMREDGTVLEERSPIKRGSPIIVRVLDDCAVTYVTLKVKENPITAKPRMPYANVRFEGTWTDGVSGATTIEITASDRTNREAAARTTAKLVLLIKP